MSSTNSTSCPKRVVEQVEHDDCPNCGTPSIPAEGVPDQSLRGCEDCGEMWFEDLNEPPRKAVKKARRKLSPWKWFNMLKFQKGKRQHITCPKHKVCVSSCLSPCAPKTPDEMDYRLKSYRHMEQQRKYGPPPPVTPPPEIKPPPELPGVPPKRRHLFKRLFGKF